MTIALLNDKIGWRQLIYAGMLGAIGSIILTAGYVLRTSDAFLGVHFIYLVGTIGVPVTSLILLVRSTRLKQRARLVNLTLATGLLLAPLGVYGTHIEPFWLRVDEVPLETSDDKAGIRIGVLSDLQTPRVGDYEIEAIETLLDQEPDLILIPGDFYQFRNESLSDPVIRDQFAEAMQILDDNVEHVYAVSGDTDRVEGLETLTEGTDVVVLDNETATLTIDGVEILIGGITHGRNEQMGPQIINELTSAPSSQLTVLLAHRPDEVFLIPEQDPIDLVVAGHTHGGQIRLPILGPPLTLTDVPREIAAGGLHRFNDQPIYVSTGVGRERRLAPQVRIGVRPSVGIIETT